MRLLEELGAITTDEQQTAYKLTPMGRQLSQLPVDPRLARMVLEAKTRLRARGDDHHLGAVDSGPARAPDGQAAGLR